MSDDQQPRADVRLEFRLLGPLEVLRDGTPVELGPPKQRAVLAALLLDEGRVVSSDRLIESVWGEDPPTRALANLQVYISKLRTLLNAEGSRGIVRRSPGYGLTADRVDVVEFRRLTELAAEGVRSRQWNDVVPAASSAIRLWRGPFLDDFADEPWVQAEAVQLDELYAQAIEAWVTGLLGLNQVAEAVTRTQTMVEAYPLREHCWWLRMIALHRASRSPEALDAFTQFTGELDEQLGLEPGPQMRELQTAILRHDEAISTWPNRPGESAPVPAATPSAPVPPAVPQADPMSEALAPPTPAGTARPAESPGPDPARAMPRESARRIVGRAEELAALDRALVDVASQQYRWVVVTGRAGIGKTRLAAEAVERAPAHGLRAIWTSCPDDTGTPAWWPLRALVTELGRDPDEIFLPPDGVDADTVRFLVYERFAHLLADAAAEQPLLVVVDDAQWLDAASVRALAYLSQTHRPGGLGVLLTVRDRERRPDFDEVLTSTGREGFAIHLSVEQLDGPSSLELLRQVAGDTITPADAFALIQRIGSNPLLLTEYARLPAEERHGGEAPLAAQGLLRRRLQRLPDGVLPVLGAAGVIGETFELDLLARVTGLNLLELADRLDAAVAEMIIDPADTGSGYQFQHGLMRDGIVAQLTVLRRQTIHARVAEALAETVTESGRDPRALIRRAQHVSAAMPILGPGPVVEACTEAARAAEEVWDWEAAAKQWEAAHRALEVLPGADVDERDLLLIAQLAALSRAGRSQTVLDTVDAALDLAESLNQTTTIGRLASVLLRTAGAWPWSAFGADSSALLARLERLTTFVLHDPAAHARVLAALAVGNCYHPDLDVPERQSRTALELAEELGQPDVLADALIGRSLAFSGVARRSQELIELLDRVRDLPPYFAQDTDEVLRHNLLTMAHFSLGDMTASREHMRTAIQGSDRQRLPLTRVQLRWAESRDAQWHGDFDRSRELAAMAVDRHRQTELYSVEVTAETSRMALLGDLGRLGETAMSQSLRDPRVWTALAAAETGDRETGRDAIVSWLADPDPEYWYSLADRTWYAHAAADLELVELAPELIRRLAPDLEHIASRGQTASVGPVSLATGKLHAVLGEVEAARADLTLAERQCREGGGAPDLIRARLALLLLESSGVERSAALERLAEEADDFDMTAVATSAREAAGA